ncbi:hypothetical protein F5883DRAFT_586719 [Diaporthe sp. PMI_573]|nr:hypothetical protein F5883DRAFT_586719 [Diaporthaceae sp. PMI_573]
MRAGRVPCMLASTGRPCSILARCTIPYKMVPGPFGSGLDLVFILIPYPLLFSFRLSPLQLMPLPYSALSCSLALYFLLPFLHYLSSQPLLQHHLYSTDLQL